jgi:hypothetical protein
MSLEGRLDGKEPFPINIEIGMPYEVGEDEWACPVSVQPLYGRLHDAHGSDSFQALFLAMRLALSLLKGFTDDGGELLMHGDGDPPALPGEGFPFGAYTIGHNMGSLPFDRKR